MPLQNGDIQIQRVVFVDGVYDYTELIPVTPPAGGGIVAFNSSTGLPQPMALCADMQAWMGAPDLATMKSGLGIPSKRQETYSGTSAATTGAYTVTFAQAYSVAPNIQANIVNASDNQFLKITSISTNGFTVVASERTDVAGLLPTFANKSGLTIDVLITEK